ncbi:MAG: hypothetical protein AAF441_05340 [Pseudomonadota bacterium]
MHKIDINSQAKPQSTSSASSSPVAAGTALGGPRRASSTWAVQARERIGNYLGNRKLRKLASAVQTSDQDIAAISGRRGDELITDLSRILMVVERDLEEHAADQVDHLFRSMLQENIRRLVVVQRCLAPSGGA